MITTPIGPWPTRTSWLGASTTPTTGFLAVPIVSGGHGLQVIGELDIATSPAVEAAVARILPTSSTPRDAGNGHSWFLLDLTAMTFCDSSGLNALGRVHTHSETRDRQVHVLGPTAGGPQRVLALAVRAGWLGPLFAPT